jgi:hypothetical protein
MTWLPRGWAACFIFLTCLPDARLAHGQETRPGTAARTNWKTGADFQRQLKVVVGLELSEAELRSSLENLAANQRVAIFIDRRIDPNQKIEFSASGVTLDELLSQLAEKVHAGTVRIGSVVYFGPQRTAGALSTVAPLRRKAVDQIPALARQRPSPWSWDELAEPRQLLADLAQEKGLTIENAEALPHDLWPAADLPPLELADKLTLLLAGFDLTFEVAADGRVRLGPLPLDEEYDQSYSPAGDVVQAAAALKREFPDVTVRREGNRLIVRAKFSDHERIGRRIAAQPRGKSAAGGQTVLYTMNPDGVPAGTVVGTVAKRLGKKFSFAAELRERLSQPVSFQVKDVSLEELMNKTLDPLGLTCRVTEDAIEVVEKSKK